MIDIYIHSNDGLDYQLPSWTMQSQLLIADHLGKILQSLLHHDGHQSQQGRGHNLQLNWG